MLIFAICCCYLVITYLAIVSWLSSDKYLFYCQKNQKRKRTKIWFVRKLLELTWLKSVLEACDSEIAWTCLVEVGSWNNCSKKLVAFDSVSDSWSNREGRNQFVKFLDRKDCFLENPWRSWLKILCSWIISKKKDKKILEVLGSVLRNSWIVLLPNLVLELKAVLDPFLCWTNVSWCFLEGFWRLLKFLIKFLSSWFLRNCIVCSSLFSENCWLISGDSRVFLVKKRKLHLYFLIWSESSLGSYLNWLPS